MLAIQRLFLLGLGSAPEELDDGNFGGFADARIGILEVRNKQRDEAAERETLCLIHLLRARIRTHTRLGEQSQHDEP